MFLFNHSFQFRNNEFWILYFYKPVLFIILFIIIRASILVLSQFILSAYINFVFVAVRREQAKPTVTYLSYQIPFSSHLHPSPTFSSANSSLSTRSSTCCFSDTFGGKEMCDAAALTW